MLTSVQLEKVEIAAKTFSNAQGITHVKVMLPEDVSSGSGSAATGQKKGNKKLDARSAAMALFKGVRAEHKLWPLDFQTF